MRLLRPLRWFILGALLVSSAAFGQTKLVVGYTSVPDFAALVRVYQETGDVMKVLGTLFGRMAVDSASGRQYIFHKTTYDRSSLESVLREAGFSSSRVYDWRNTIHKDYDDFSQAYYPHMDKEHGLQISLNMEAIR